MKVVFSQEETWPATCRQLSPSEIWTCDQKTELAAKWTPPADPKVFVAICVAKRSPRLCNAIAMRNAFPLSATQLVL
jgi:hypothetical protein